MNQSQPIFNYQSASCNIGTYEKKMRRRAGFLGIFSTILGIIFLFIFKWDPINSLLLIFPIYLSIIGFYQSESNFCIGFALKGIYNMDENSRRLKKIHNEVQRKLDQKKALKMIFIAFILSTIIMLSIYFLIFLIFR